MNISRRLLFVGTTALAACATLTPSQAIIDAGIILGDDTATPPTGLIGAYADFKSTYADQISAAIDAKVSAAYTEAKTLLAEARAATSATLSASNLSQVINNAGTIVAVLTPLAVSSPSLELALEAAGVMIPVVQVEIAALTPSASAAPVTAKMSPWKMSPEQARKVLS